MRRPTQPKVTQQRPGRSILLKIFSVQQAEKQLSGLLAAVEAGEEVVIARDGKPVARIVAYECKGKRRFGALVGRIAIDDSFHGPLPEAELSTWEG